MIYEQEINDYAKKIYEQNKAVGWWDDPNRCIFQTLQLVSTEIAEATEGERKNLMDDHLPHRKMGEVELADALIRLLDLAGRYEWSFNSAMGSHIGIFAVDSIAGRHFFLNDALIELGRVCRGVKCADTNECYSILLSSIVSVAEQQGYDIYGAMNEKLAYNKNRADHKRNNRAKEGGKAF